MAWHLLWVVLLSAVLTSAAHADDLIPQLSHNPFTRPALGTETAGRTEQVRPPVRVPVVRATLEAGKHSLANVNGKLIAIGEEFEGYRLIRVGAGDATFVRNGEEVTVVVGIGAPGNDDD